MTIKSTIQRTVRGIRDNIPSGFVLGRKAGGSGAVELISFRELATQFVQITGGGGPTLVAANPTATASDVAVNGSATTFMRSDAAPAVQKGSNSAFGIVKVDGTTITASGGVISNAPLGFTPSAVAFAGATGNLAQDAAWFSWNSTTHSLFVGSASTATASTTTATIYSLSTATSGYIIAGSMAQQPNPSADSTASFRGLVAQCTSISGNPYSVSNMMGLNGQCNWQSSGGTLATAHGLNFVVRCGPPAGQSAVITAAYGLFMQVQNTGTVPGSNIVTGYGAYIPAPYIPGAGTITTCYGMRIEAQQITGVTTGYGLGVAGATTPNFFQGPLRVGNVGAPPASVSIDLASTTGALLLNRLTTTQKNALTPASGMVVYDSTLGAFQGYRAGAWNNLGAGTVSSVGLTMPGMFTVTGSPVTGSGTLAATLATQSANLLFAGPPSGAAAAPTFRALTSADIAPALTSGDLYWNATSLLLSVPVSTIADTSTFARTVTSVGAVATSSSVQRFATQSIDLTAAGAYLTVPAASDWVADGTSLGFTWEMWLYLTSVTGTDNILLDNRGASNTPGCVLFLNSSRQLCVYDGATKGAAGSAVALNAWYHVAFTAINGLGILWLNGVPQSVFAFGNSGAPAAVLRVGMRNDGTLGARGYYDQVRITPLVCRYTAPFVPSSLAFPTNQGQWLPVGSGAAGQVLATTTGTGTLQNNSGAFATKGNTFAVGRAITITKAYVPLASTSAGTTYQCAIFPVNTAATSISGVAVGTATLTGISAGLMEFTFAAPVALAAQTTYAVLITGTAAAADNSICNIFSCSSSGAPYYTDLGCGITYGNPSVVAAFSGVTRATRAPANGDALSPTGNTAYQIGLLGYFT